MRANEDERGRTEPHQLSLAKCDAGDSDYKGHPTALFGLRSLYIHSPSWVSMFCMGGDVSPKMGSCWCKREICPSIDKECIVSFIEFRNRHVRLSRQLSRNCRSGGTFAFYPCAIDFLIVLKSVAYSRKWMPYKSIWWLFGKSWNSPPVHCTFLSSQSPNDTDQDSHDKVQNRQSHHCRLASERCCRRRDSAGWARKCKVWSEGGQNTASCLTKLSTKRPDNCRAC